MTAFADKIKSIHFGRADHRAPKQTVHHIDAGTVTTTEHWDDRVDQLVKPKTLRMGLKRED